MRVILFIIGLAVLVVVLLMAFGLINIDQTRTAQLPSIKVQGGQAPSFQADVGSVDVGTVNKTVAVPQVQVNKPADAPPAQ